MKHKFFTFLGVSAILAMAALSLSPADDRPNERFTGTLNYQRSDQTQEDQSNADMIIESRVRLAESAFAQVVLEYYRSQGGVDFYKSVDVKGSASLKYSAVQTLKPRDPDQGPGGTISDTVDCTPSLSEGGLLRVYLEIDRRNKTYALSCDLTTPSCDDTYVVSGNPLGDIVARGQFSRSIGAHIEEFTGSTDGNTVAGTGSSGTAGWSWSFTGLTPDAEAVIIPPKDFDKWLPRGGPDEKTRGDAVEVKARVHKKGNPDKKSHRKAQFRFELVDVSQETGICMELAGGRK